MSINLNILAESDLELTLEGDWQRLADFKYPDGTTQEDVPCQITWNDVEFNPQTGEPMVGRVNTVTARISSLNYTPVQGETVQIRFIPSNTATEKIDTISSATRPPKINSIGWVTFYPQLVEQSLTS